MDGLFNPLPRPPGAPRGFLHGLCFQIVPLAGRADVGHGGGDGHLADVGAKGIRPLRLDVLPDLGNGLLFGIGTAVLTPEQESGKNEQRQGGGEGEQRVPARQWLRSRRRCI